MNLSDFGFTRRHLRQGGGRGSGADHFEDLVGCTEFYIYQTPNVRPKGYEALKTVLEAHGCEIIFTMDAPPELGDRYETMRVTHRRAEAIPVPALKRAHTWAHQRNYLHSFFKPLYR